ncbi:MarR family winged helix-turn-helix transcriptional regulator [Anaerocolumna sp. MB42-C2]|uniref:MarR family winged helix-turn-helix transcriptional regulator n=1 Tax=Anaerocolumna sp. MB42-C2 TaxID=3070997 RepID=UPI0027E1F9CC|nr:MarR family transcriptional regulator [Anaerocolumna sp. MB42-C2]WMJ89890.1 MarR family transcriptional regulator [Anaerocolumna sp. MB42-C2]
MEYENNNVIPEQIESWYNQWILVERLYTEFAKRYDLTSSALFVLRAIFEHSSGCTQRSICEALFYPKQTVSSIIQGLINKNIAGKKQSKEDKRNYDIYLTEKGYKFTLDMINALKKAETEAFESIKPKDMEDFTRINETLTKAIRVSMYID